MTEIRNYDQKLQVDPRGIITANSKVKPLRRPINEYSTTANKKIKYGPANTGDDGVDAGDPLVSFHQMPVNNPRTETPLDFCSGNLNNLQISLKHYLSAKKDLKHILNFFEVMEVDDMFYDSLNTFEDFDELGSTLPYLKRLIDHLAILNHLLIFRGIAKSSTVYGEMQMAVAQNQPLAIVERGKLSTWNSGTSYINLHDRIFVTVPPENNEELRTLPVSQKRNSMKPNSPKKNLIYINDEDLSKLVVEAIVEIGETQNQPPMSYDFYDALKTTIKIEAPKVFRSAYVGVSQTTALVKPGHTFNILRFIC